MLMFEDRMWLVREAHWWRWCGGWSCSSHSLFASSIPRDPFCRDADTMRIARSDRCFEIHLLIYPANFGQEVLARSAGCSCGSQEGSFGAGLVWWGLFRILNPGDLTPGPPLYKIAPGGCFSCSVVAGGGQGHLLFILMMLLSWFFVLGNRWIPGVICCRA